MAGHVFDYSGWRPNPADLKAAGVVGVCRYLATPAQSWKVITKGEYDRTLAAGMPVTLNWEETAGAWRGGFSLGVQHGRTARQMARLLGHPDERPIIQSIDTAVTPGELNIAVDYQRGFNDGGGLGPQGVYGTKYVIDSLFTLGLVRVGWQAAARGWFGNGSDCANAALIQRVGKSYPQFPSPSYDENTVHKDDWGQHPAPQGEEMALTAEEIAASNWNHGLPDPADGNKLKPAGALLGYARHDSYNAFVQTVTNTQKLDALAAQVAALALGSGDAEAIQAAIREIVREELDNTRLGLAG